MVFFYGGNMLEKYYNYKIIYKDYMIFIKSGNFYELFEKDALIINKILGYKIKRFSKTFKSGFPISKINYVLNLVCENSINYVVIEEKEKIIKKFEKNKYLDFYFDLDELMLKYLKIDKIINYLNDNILSENLMDILKEMEKLL